MWWVWVLASIGYLACGLAFGWCSTRLSDYETDEFEAGVAVLAWPAVLVIAATIGVLLLLGRMVGGRG